MRRALNATQFTWLLSVALAAGATGMTSVAGGGLIMSAHLPLDVAVLAVGAGFLFTEQFLLNVEFRRQAHSFTLAGVPLLIGVLVLPPLAFVATRLVASVLAFAWQRVSADKMAYNAAAYVFEAAADVALVHFLLAPDQGLDPRTALTLIAIMAGVDQLMSGLVLVMIRVHDGPLSREAAIEVLIPALILSVASTLFAFSMIILFQQGVLGTVVAVVLVGIFGYGYRAYAAARQRHASLAMVHEFVTGGVGAQSLESLAQELLSRIRRLLRAGARSGTATVRSEDRSRTPARGWHRTDARPGRAGSIGRELPGVRSG